MCVYGTGQNYYLLSQIAEFYAKEDRCVGALVNWHPCFDLALFPYIILCGKPNHKPYLVLSVGGEYKWLINTKFYLWVSYLFCSWNSMYFPVLSTEFLVAARGLVPFPVKLVRFMGWDWGRDSHRWSLSQCGTEPSFKNL